MFDKLKKFFTGTVENSLENEDVVEAETISCFCDAIEPKTMVANTCSSIIEAEKETIEMEECISDDAPTVLSEVLSAECEEEVKSKDDDNDIIQELEEFFSNNRETCEGLSDKEHEYIESIESLFNEKFKYKEHRYGYTHYIFIAA